MSVEVDFKALDAIAALQRPNKPNLLARVVDLFESESPKCIAQIQEGVSAKDLDLVRMGAHSLKSSSANIGAVDLSARCRDIEASARENDLDACVELAEHLMAEFEASLIGIREYMEKAA